LLAFLSGIGLLGLTFRLAYDMFTVPPKQALDITPGKPVDLGSAGQSAVALIVRVLLLAVMALVSSMIAHRGLQMYTGSLHPRIRPAKKPEPAEEEHE